MAWLSTEGFHCGSRIWILEAAVKLSLNGYMLAHKIDGIWPKFAYPIEPVPRVIKSTVVSDVS